MRPTFGDTRPTFGYPPPSPAVKDGPERPSIGVQLGMDGTELPALDHRYPIWTEAHDFEPAPDGLCNVCGNPRTLDAHSSAPGDHFGSWRTCPSCKP